MRKIILALLLFISLFMLVGCTSNTNAPDDNTTQPQSSTPINQDSLLNSLSQAIKNIFD